MPRFPQSMRPQNSAHERLRRVEGRHNSLVKELRRAFTQGELTEQGDCAIEGLRIVEEAIRSGLRFDAIFFRETADSQIKRLLPQIGAHVETVVLPDKLFASAVPSDSPQGVAALVRYPTHKLDDVLARATHGPVVLIAGLQDPGNLGTVLRSAEAFGAVGVLLGDGTVSAFNPKVVRGSAGSLFRLPVIEVTIADVIPLLKGNGVRLVGTSSHKGTSLPEADLKCPLAVIIGAEGAGVPRDLMAKVDEVLKIPHAAQVESLNAGVAASIVLYEIARQKR